MDSGVCMKVYWSLRIPHPLYAFIVSLHRLLFWFILLLISNAVALQKILVVALTSLQAPMA